MGRTIAIGHQVAKLYSNHYSVHILNEIVSKRIVRNDNCDNSDNHFLKIYFFCPISCDYSHTLNNFLKKAFGLFIELDADIISSSSSGHPLDFIDFISSHQRLFFTF